MRDKILRVVKRHNGIKAEKLELDVIDECWPMMCYSDEYHITISKLVNSGELIEFEYLSPNETKVNKIYFISGTIFSDLKVGDIARNPNETIVDGEGKRNT